MVVRAQPDLVDAPHRDGVVGDVVDLPGQILVEGHVGVLDGQVGDAVQLDVGGVPVAGVLHHHDLVLGAPGLEHVGAVADEVGRLGPLAGPEPVHREGGGDHEGAVGEHGQGVGQGPHEGHHEGAPVRRLDLHPGGGPAALEVGVGAFDAVAQQVGVGRPGFRVQHPHPRVHHVLGHQRGAVRPGGLAQAEGVGAQVPADRPGGGQARDRQGGPGVVDGEALEQRVADAGFRDPGDQRRIQRQRLGAVVEDEILGRQGQGRQQRQDASSDLDHLPPRPRIGPLT